MKNIMGDRFVQLSFGSISVILCFSFALPGSRGGKGQAWAWGGFSYLEELSDRFLLEVDPKNSKLGFSRKS